MNEDHKLSLQLLDRLIKSYPRKDLRLQQVYALEEAKEHIAEHRAKLQSELTRLTDRV
jgi:hypothetical protein